MPHFVVAKCQIHAQLGANEEMIHSQNLVFEGDDEQEFDVPAMTTLAGQLATAWSTYLNDTPYIPKSFLQPGVVYDEIRLSQWSIGDQAIPGGGYSNSLITPTVVAPITSGTGTFAVGGGTLATSPKPLPNEVAMVLTLNTAPGAGRRGRGRIYLGGFGSGVMSTGVNGLFDPSATLAIAQTFGTEWVQRIKDTTGHQLVIVSETNLGALEDGPSYRPVIGVSVGQVPDAQRRRRKSQAENYQIAWTAA